MRVSLETEPASAESAKVGLVSKTVPVTEEASIVSPFAAVASAARNEPGPLSAVLLAVMVAARTVLAPAQNKAKQTAATQIVSANPLTRNVT